MNAALQTQLTFAALACSVLALFFSLLAAFPGLKLVLAAVRDGVLWVALFLVLGAAAFVVWQQVEGKRPRLPSVAMSPAADEPKAGTTVDHAPRMPRVVPMPESP